MPLYNTSSTAIALGVHHKWIDNLLSHNKIEGVQQARQGVSRRLSLEAIMTIKVAQALSHSAGIPTSKALAIASDLLTSETGMLAISPALTLRLDQSALRRQTIDRLAHAMEVLPAPTRGRPKRR